jgi:hypothetical protein
MIMDCYILLPKCPSVDAAFQSHVMDKEESLGRCGSVRLLQFRAETPGFLWRGLHPLLMESSKGTAKRALEAQFKLVGLPALPVLSNDDQLHLMAILKEFQGMVYRRRIRLVLRNSSAPPQKETAHHLVIWIQPPSSTYYQKDFSKALIAWENTLILYQSLAAWISTLGGGYFFCRHLRTAVALAQQQRQIALLMGDCNMAYKCTINEAYSYIYAGKFAMAFKTIDYIDVLHKRVDTQSRMDTTIRNMCQSARLFCMRVRKASKKLETSRKQQTARTIDDYQRIRVIQ